MLCGDERGGAGLVEGITVNCGEGRGKDYAGGNFLPAEYLKDGDFDFQEFFGILAEVADEKAHVAGEAGEIVVEFGVRKKFAGSGGVVVEFGGGGGEVGAGVAKFVVESVVSGEFSEGAFAGANVSEHGVGAGDG